MVALATTQPVRRNEQALFKRQTAPKLSDSTLQKLKF